MKLPISTCSNRYSKYLPCLYMCIWLVGFRFPWSQNTNLVEIFSKSKWKKCYMIYSNTRHKIIKLWFVRLNWRPLCLLSRICRFKTKEFIVMQYGFYTEISYNTPIFFSIISLCSECLCLQYSKHQSNYEEGVTPQIYHKMHHQGNRLWISGIILKAIHAK